MIDVKNGVIVKDTFLVLDSNDDPVPGLTNSSFTKKLFDPTNTEVSGSIPVTIVEIQGGLYEFSFTPNALGLWTVGVIHATYFPAGQYGGFNSVASVVDDVAVAVGNVQTDTTDVKNATIKFQSSVSSASSTTVFADSSLSFGIDTLLKNNVIVFTTGSNAGLSRRISFYNAATQEITVDRPWASIPVTSDFYLCKHDIAADALDVASKVWDEQLSTHLSTGSAGKALDDADAVADPSTTADAVWNKAISGFSTAGTFGKELGDMGIAFDVDDPHGKIDDIHKAVISRIGSVSSVYGLTNTMFTDISDVKPIEFYSHQFIVFNSGANAGQVREILSYGKTLDIVPVIVPGLFVLDSTLSSAIIPGHSYTVLSGLSQVDSINAGSTEAGTTTFNTGVPSIDRSPTRLG